jgi:hypothetical protein
MQDDELPVVDPLTGEVQTGPCVVSRIPISKFKREYLELTEDIVQALGQALEKEPILAFDGRMQREYILDYYPHRRLLGGLAEWFRENQPQQDEYVLVTVLDSVRRRIDISMDRSPESSSSEGLYLGREFATVGGRKYETKRPCWMDETDLLTHAFICGITGSGKTVVGKAIVEEAAKKGIPSILIDLKGDLTSIALTPTSVEEFEPLVEAKGAEERRKLALKEYERHVQKLAEFGQSIDDVRKYREQVTFRVFTPRSQKGQPLSFASPLGAPPYPVELQRTDSETFNNLIASLVNAFLDRLYPGTKRSKIENERSFVYELVHHAWQHGIDLQGKKGLHELLRLIQEPPFREIGGLPVEKYIDAENRRNRLLNKINTMLTGAEKMWFEGTPVSMDLFLTHEPGKSPINVINLAELDHFEDRSFVVAQIAYEVNKWMRGLAGTSKPRLLFFIDEIGGGGGKQALFPSFPYESAAKWGLNYLVRQGRAVGVCCLFATQNPGDVDYKGLSNCQTWIIGRLATERDRKKVLEGMEVWGQGAEWVKRNMAGAPGGDFVIKTAKGEIKYFHERWLLSYHRVLTLAEVAALRQRMEN